VLSLYGLAAMMSVLALLLTVSAVGNWNRQSDLAEGARGLEPSVADEAQAWLDRRARAEGKDLA
jgi:hypothetical protein